MTGVRLTPIPTPTDTPLDPTSLTGGIFNGPYGFLVAIAFFLFLAMRELRRYKEIDNASYRTEIASLKEDMQNLTNEVHQLRDEKFTGAQTAAREKETLIRENAGLRALCADNRIDTSGVTSG